MKKKWVLIIIAVFIFIGVLIIFSIVRDRRQSQIYYGETLPVKYELIGESGYDPSPIYKDYVLKVGSEFTEWEWIGGEDSLSNIEDYTKLDGPVNFNFDKYALLITFGRRIAG